MAKLISMMGDFITEGEQRAAEQLKQLPEQWSIILNKIITDTKGKGYEVDVIIVATRWIFVLDEKSWNGPISGNDTYWKLADYGNVPSPLQKLEYTARIVRGYLDRYVSSFKLQGRYVQSGILLSAAESLPQIVDPRARNGVFLLDDVCERLEHLDTIDGNPLISQFRSKIVEVLTKLSHRQVIDKRIGQYTVQDIAEVHPGIRKVHALTDDGQLRILMVYDLGQDPTERQSLRDFYLKEYQALRDLKSTGVVPDAQDYFDWPDRFLVFPYLPIKGTSFTELPIPTRAEELKTMLAIAAHSFQALETIHSKGILHRAINPGTVWIAGQRKIAFTDFYAARVGTQSIANRLDNLALSREDPYASNDLAVSYGFATPATDCYSLAVVFMERITGQSVRIIQEHIQNALHFRDLFQMWGGLPLAVYSELIALFESIVLADPRAAKDMTAREVSKRFSALAAATTQESSSVPESGPGEKYVLNKDNVRIDRLLGEGQFCKTYLAYYHNAPELRAFVLKQLREPTSWYEQCLREYQMLEKLKSPYFPNIYDIYPETDQFHIKMEYIPGQTLLQLESSFPWSLDRWWVFTKHILSALTIMEQHSIVHRDIKLANLILHEDEGIPVFIDFGFAHQAGASDDIQGSPFFLAPEILQGDSTITSAQDRYAACIVLFKILTGHYPFEMRLGEPVPITSDMIVESDVAQQLVAQLGQALHPDPAQRPQSAMVLRHSLEHVFFQQPIGQPRSPQQSWQVNPWVDKIRSLYRNSRIGNSDNRGLDSTFARTTYIATMLDKRIMPEALRLKPAVVFLNGNPGDGKTAFLERVKQALVDQNAQRHWDNPSGWEYELNGHVYRSCYDASESTSGQSADEQLGDKLQGMAGVCDPGAHLTVFVAINDGRQIDFFERHLEYQWVHQESEAFQAVPDLEQRRVWIIDLKERALVNWPEEPSLADAMLTQFVATEQWATCDGCAAANVCPLYQNAQALRNDTIRQRIDYLLLLVHLRRQYHLTMRDLRSTLAYIVTGDTGCTEIHALVQQKAFGDLASLTYWNRTFTDERIDETLLTQIRQIDPGKLSHPVFDRYLHYHRGEEESNARRALFMDRVDLPHYPFPSERQWMMAFKRKYYFEAAPNDQMSQDKVILPEPEHLLPYQHAQQFMVLLRGSSEMLAAELPQIARGMLVSENVIVPLGDSYMNIVVKSSEARQFLVLKRFPLSLFSLIHAQDPYHDIIETIPDRLVLHDTRQHHLDISLDLFEMLCRMAAGHIPRSHELLPLLEDLMLFKNRLQLEDTKELVLVDHASKIYRLSQQDGILTLEG